MADARALLRAHRADNRIKHQHAAYSDAGKLLCKLCHEAIKTEALWEGHIRGANHRRNLQNGTQTPQSQAPAPAPAPAPPGHDNNNSSSSSSSNNTSGSMKRKHDESMSDADEDPDSDWTRKKRSRTDGTERGKMQTRATPPQLVRGTSGAPVQGMEIAIPSRPATPHAGGGSSGSSNSTPTMNLSSGRSPLIDLQQQAPHPQQQPPPTSAPTTAPPVTATANTTTTTMTSAVDEAEWAAFEAEIAAADIPAAPTGPRAYDEAAAVISAPALTAEQAKSLEEENERRRTQLLDTAIADEREDAAASLLAEFEEMEELEDRVRRLKERREELRKAGAGGAANVGAGPTLPTVVGGSGKAAGAVAAAGKENAAGDEVDDEEEDEDEDDEEEYDVFRFRA
ncbi:hypothetical protein DL764_000553 [Monosporascus ibericus]|uniref:Coiled-coil domain-containing protein 16 n=1 Tax=Monosporascus ibericus TaxID=155417 RepID=A0A4Q4TY67_9PEZI|nr:hypothetical protein DL764_000553 [Monosporascus ibericus]